ncbi:MAG: alpha/beta hydrolase [Anaerolineales bacterium]|nr:alpha/beta hydrolase [Anaerolineales bacterium]
MEIVEWTWTSFDQIDMYGRRWMPSTTIQACIVLVHGLGEHCQRYDHLGAVLAQNGYALMGFDLRGHGRSGGQRGHAPSFEAFMKDMDSMFEQAASLFPNTHRFIYGHSLGGILTLNYVLRRKPALAGAVVTSPGLRTALEKQKAKVALAKLLGTLLPASGLPSGLNADMISRDPAVVERYRNDPLVHDKITFGMAKGLLEAIGWAFEHAHEFHIPLLLMHGSQDQIAFVSGSEDFAARVPKGCTLKVWEGLYHEPHNEPEKEQVFAYLLDWLQQTLSTRI